MPLINPYIFREYDIRGKVVEDFPEHVVVKLGKAFGTFVKRAGGQEIALSGDIRLTTPDLMTYFKSGVLSTGNSKVSNSHWIKKRFLVMISKPCITSWIKWILK